METEKFLNIIKNFKNQKILVVGDLMLDEYLIGSVDRISPEAPIPILDVKEISHNPGGAANTACNVKSLGGDVILSGVIGQDERGSLLKDLLSEKGIDVRGIVADPKRKTTLKARAVAKNQHIVRIDIEEREPISAEVEAKLLQFIESQVSGIKAIIISDYAKGVITANLSRKIIGLARDHNIFSLVDGKSADFSKYSGCNIIAPNKKEMGKALNIPLEQLALESRFLQAGKMLLAHVMSENVLIKCGEDGMSLLDRDGNYFQYPALNKQPLDVSGAGDIAISVFALAMVAGSDSKEAVILASHACAVGVGKPGTAVISPEELWESLKVKNQ